MSEKEAELLIYIAILVLMFCSLKFWSMLYYFFRKTNDLKTIKPKLILPLYYLIYAIIFIAPIMVFYLIVVPNLNIVKEGNIILLISMIISLISFTFMGESITMMASNVDLFSEFYKNPKQAYLHYFLICFYEILVISTIIILFFKYIDLKFI